jgi:hypothetical protein
MTEMTSSELRRVWLEHPHFKYRGCQPDPDEPLRMAGNPALHVGAHHGPDAFAPEGQRERRAREAAAVEVCLSCPVMVACDAYASSVTADGRLAEPDGVWGGRTALERHKALIRARHAVPAAPNRRFQTAQKRAALAALARCWEPFEVAAEASRLLALWGEGPEGGMDVRTANWQRSSLVRLLGLPRDVSRMRALAAARERGLLEGVVVVADDGSVPAVPPPTKLPASEPVVVPAPVLVAAESASLESADAGRVGAVLPIRPGRSHVPRHSRRSRVRVIPGQLSLDDALTPAVSLFPSHAALGAAA